MSELDYKPNSDKHRENEARNELSPSERGVIPIRNNAPKPSKAREVSGLFFKSDAHTVANSVILDIIIPSVIDIAMDSLHGAVDMFFKGSMSGRSSYRRGGRDRYSSRYRESEASYRRYYDDDDDRGRRHRGRDYDEPSYRRSSKRRKYSLDDITDLRPWEYDEMMDEIAKIHKKYGFVQVADIYEIMGWEWDREMKRWGWYDLEDIKGGKMRGGTYYIEFSEPEKFKD